LRSRAPEDILTFLNDWNRRVKIDSTRLNVVLDKYQSLFEKLAEKVIVSIDFKEQIDVGNEVRPLHDVIVELFLAFETVSISRKNYAGASKILHVIVPGLFVMWDDTIRCAYGCRIEDDRAGKEYFRFLVRVQKQVREAVESYHVERNCGLEEASELLEKELYEGGFYKLARLVDEHNFQKYTEGRDELW
jgi:hypothetical protein